MTDPVRHPVGGGSPHPVTAPRAEPPASPREAGHAAVSRPGAGGITLHEEDIDIDREISAAARAFAKRASAADLKIDVAPSPAPRQVRVDRGKIRQLLVNLISEAVEFTPRGGTVAISTSIDGSGDLTLTVAHTGLGLNGRPVTPAPFGPDADGPWRSFWGSGLGLALAQVLAECHGGSLQLDNTTGGDARVRVTLPRTRILS